MSNPTEDLPDTDPDFATTPEGEPIEPEKIDDGAVVPTENDGD